MLPCVAMTTATTPITVDLPVAVAERLRKEAGRQQRAVRDLVRDLIVEHWSEGPALPQEVEAELDALSSLSDDLLWLAARSTLPDEDREELALLNAKGGSLMPDQEQRRKELLNAYDRIMVRRAQAAVILQERGYDLSDPSIL